MEKPIEKPMKKEPKEFTVIQLMEKISKLVDHKRKLMPVSVLPWAGELAARLGLAESQAVMLSVISNLDAGNRIKIADIADKLGMTVLAVIDHYDDIESLLHMNLLKKHRGDDESFFIPIEVLKDLRKGKVPSPVVGENLAIDDFVVRHFRLLDGIDGKQVDEDYLYDCFDSLIKMNQHLYVAQKLKEYHFDNSDLVLFWVMSRNFIENHDDIQMSHDIEEYFAPLDLRYHVRHLERGDHELMKKKIVEFSTSDGMVKPDVWKLTDYAKNDIFRELELANTNMPDKELKKHSEITAKKLYYNSRVARQVAQLESILDEGRMSGILDSLERHGMRKGFTCLFYGAPGTGKTETVLQLARQSGRDIMQVDVPSIRSKWVGETEQNIKSLFDRYRAACKKENKAPILLFNEADALLNKRLEGGTGAVDKMENAMQNIILQEMETIEGIMIATTNLTGSLDKAFERRFLYKVEFEKPEPEQRAAIWKEMLPELSDDQAMTLAGRFDFSGGQIENIARKRIVDCAISGSNGIDMEQVMENCQSELIGGTAGSHSAIGFK